MGVLHCRTITNKKSHVNLIMKINQNEPVSIEQKIINSPRRKPRKISKESFHSTESEILNTVKKHNREFEDFYLIDNCLTKHFFMRVLDKDSRREVVKEMSLCQIDKNQTIFSQASIGNFFYIIKSGTVGLSINGEHLKYLNQGESFGELALLHGATRSGTIKSTTECLLWVLERRNFKKVVDHINHLNFEENKKFITSVNILSNIENDQKAILCSNLIKVSYDAGQLIVKEGEVANCLYIIKVGEVECICKRKLIRTLYRGDNFGSTSILLDVNRTMDVIAKTDCICYSISKETLKSMVGEKYREILYVNFLKSAVNCSHYLKNINLRLIEDAFECFKAENFLKNEIVLKKGYIKNSNFMIIVEGNLINNQTKQIVASRGNIVFEQELYEDRDEITDYDIIAEPDCLLLQADMQEFSQVLDSTLLQLNNKSQIYESILKVDLFKNFSKKKLNNLCDILKTEKFEDESKIISMGEEGTKFYIVKNGKVDIYINRNYVRTLNEHEYFGDRALFFKEPRSATAIAKGKVEVFYLEKEDFLNIIENNMKEFLLQRLYLRDTSLELEDLDYIGKLGSGNYGQVYLVQMRKTKFLYAIKSISKRQIDSDGIHTNLELERSILLQIDHPFIVKLVKTLKDETHIYFLMEYIKGQDLFNVIRDIGYLSKYQTMFYGASIMLAVEYLHLRKFIYRDIKPENIMVIENGFIKLIDFGTAKNIFDRTSTIIGTPHYMAPEIILGEGYSFAVDYWSIAICMYEFYCGSVPFGENSEDPMQVYVKIINDQLTFPDTCKDKEFKILLNLLLSKNPLKRLFKISQIKNNIWFNEFDWENLINMNIEPAFIPDIKKEEIISENKISFLDHIKHNVKDWEPGFPLNSSNKIDAQSQENYDNWFSKF